MSECRCELCGRPADDPWPVESGGGLAYLCDPCYRVTTCEPLPDCEITVG